MNNKIDIIIPWVDGADPEWNAEKKKMQEKYKPEEKSNSNIRFESWDNLHFWFRAIEKNMPWINRIHFVTWGHVPAFLKLDHPKLHVVKHTDYIPQEYLPTYNSNTIEINYHRIQELAENFIIFNDDMFPLQPIDEEYYFVDDQVCDEAIENIIVAKTEGPISNMARYTQVNNMILINKYFDKRRVMLEHPEIWVGSQYGDLSGRTESLSYWNTFAGFHDPHMPSSMKKSTLEKLWRLEPEVLHNSSKNHFRSYSDLTQYLIRYWQICEGMIKSRRTLGKMCVVNRDNYALIAQGIKSQQWQMISINEDCDEKEFEEIKKEINKAFQILFPYKSSFEK